MTTTTTRCLLNDNVGLGTAVCVSLLTQTESARWVYHGHNGGQGKVRGLKNNVPWRLLGLAGEELAYTCVLSASGYGAVEESGGRNRTLSSSVRLTRTTAKKQRPHKEIKQAGEASWLK